VLCGVSLIAAEIQGRSPETLAATPAGDQVLHLSHPDLPFTADFAPGTDPEYMAEMMQRLAERFGQNLEFNPFTRWPGTPGTPVDLTFSFPPDGTSIQGGGATSLFSTLNSEFGDESTWMALIDQALSAWGEVGSSVTGNTYTQVPDDGAPVGDSFPGPLTGGSGRGDVRIVALQLDGPGGVLAFNPFPPNGDMFLDEDENWGQPFGNFRFFRNVVSHEHGHGLGLLHVCPANQSKLMAPFIATNFDSLQFDDTLGAQSLYGDALEPNNAMGGASSLEEQGLQSGQMLTINLLSLDEAGDQDFFSFEAFASSEISLARVVPEGFTYLEGDQLPSGACESGTPFDALNIADLELAVFDPSGDLLASSNQTGSGQAEELTGVQLPVDGEYTVRVSASSSTGSVQRYRLEFNADLEALFGDLSGDGEVDGADLGILLGQWGTDGSADLNGDGTVDGSDLGLLLGAWDS